MPFDIDRHAHITSPLQAWDARYKLFGLGIAILAVSLIDTLPLALLAAVAAAGVLALGRLPSEFVLGGLKWVVLFLLPFFIVMPISYPGEPDLHVLGLPFAWGGFRIATLLVLKAVAIVILAYSIFTTTRFDVAVIALQHLKLPKAFVQMLLFTYRYIFVFVSELKRRETAMKARGFIARPNFETLRVFGNFVGTLLVRSFERTDRIYKAMLAKGYQGEYHTLTRFEAGTWDRIKTGTALCAALMLLIIDHSGLFAPAASGWF